MLQIKVEMAYQLYVLQTLVLGLLEQRMNTKMDPEDQDSRDKIKVCSPKRYPFNSVILVLIDL
jgi:hypothetical protein